MKRIDPHDGLNGECQGAPSRHPMFRGSILRLNMGGASPRGAFPRSALASERLVSERSGSSEQSDRGRPFGCPAFDPPPCPKRSESLSARRTCRRCTCQLVDFFLANSLRGKRHPTPPFFLFSFPSGLAGPAAHETLPLCGRVVGIEVGIRLVRLSPLFSWTRGSWSTSDCRHGLSSAPEHAS
jgi:hypothetical protein